MSSDSANISKPTANIASPAFIAVASSYATCTASNPLLIGSWSIISSWINVKLWIISIDAPRV